MALIDLASSNSLWRGMDYFESNKVKEVEKINDNEYKSIVSGSSDYNVFINLNHPRKSTCSCPFAEGRRVICKHMVATYFKIYPVKACAPWWIRMPGSDTNPEPIPSSDTKQSMP